LGEYYVLEALTYAEPQWFGYLFIKNNIFISKWMQDRTYPVIDSLTVLLEFAEKENREEAIPILCLNLGSRFLKSDPQKALSYFTKMQSMEFDNPKTRANLFGNMSSYYMDITNNNQAYKCLIGAKNIMETNHDYNSLPKLYHNFSFFYESQQQYDSALYYAQKELELTQQIFSNTIAIETHQKYVTTFLEAAQKDLTIAEQKNKLKNKQLVIIAVTSGAIIIVILLILLLVNQQKRRKASENRELTVKLEHEKAKSEHEKKVQQYEKKTQKLEREKQREVLDAKTREITSYSLLVSNKNQLLQQIMELTAQIFNNKENATITAAKIEEVIQNNLTIDKEWANFKMHFDNVHPHFFEKLKQCCHDLTEENIKMCAYIKMGMTPKQISQLQHVAPRSVIINRYRLKKKLQIPEAEDLECFIGKL
jgi:tetratricopeptide (TPR) repeat protein